jgi:glycosyltransferase involved in cell wall biosynthesis
MGIESYSRRRAEKFIVNEFFLIVSHARFDDKGEPVHGTASELAPYLERKKKYYLYIQHSLFNGMATKILTFKNKKKYIKNLGLTFLPFPLRIIQEYFITVRVILQLNKMNKYIYVGIDPLNAYLGIMLRNFGKVNKVIFYTADYADKRYENNFMNFIYHWFDKYSVKNADQIWNVSTRITDIRIKQGVPNNKNFFIPNTPAIKISRKISSNFKQHTLVIVTHITKATDFMSMIDAIKQLKVKYKDIKLLIVGDGDYREELIRIVESLQLNKNIIFTGSKTHEDVLKIIASAGIGLAIYTNQFPWTKYGDSMKAREYLAFGLPVIINDVTSTSDDIKKANAGIVITSNTKIKNAIEKLFSNKKEYAIMRDNAFALAKETDFSHNIEKTKLLN